jgi:asparagine synthase (glutamine-hydrolysing)
MIDASSIQGWWEGWLAAADRPSVDGLNSFIVSGAVKREGATVAFSGLGADELFGGYASFHRVRYLAPILRSLSLLPRSLRRLLAQIVSLACPPRYRSRLMALAESSGRLTDVSIELKQFLPASSLEALGLHAEALGIRSDFLAEEALSFLHADRADAFTIASRVETYLFMGNTLLRDADATSMAHSLELRVPFVARPVLEFAGRLPGRMHLAQRGPGKQMLRRALQDVLPHHVISRSKTGFSLPVHDWMYSQLRDSCEAAVESAATIPFLDAHEVRRLWARFLADRDHTYWMKPMLLVALGDYVARVAEIQAG